MSASSNSKRRIPWVWICVAPALGAVLACLVPGPVQRELLYRPVRGGNDRVLVKRWSWLPVSSPLVYQRPIRQMFVDLPTDDGTLRPGWQAFDGEAEEFVRILVSEIEQDPRPLTDAEAHQFFDQHRENLQRLASQALDRTGTTTFDASGYTPEWRALGVEKVHVSGNQAVEFQLMSYHWLGNGFELSLLYTKGIPQPIVADTQDYRDNKDGFLYAPLAEGWYIQRRFYR